MGYTERAFLVIAVFLTVISAVSADSSADAAAYARQQGKYGACINSTVNAVASAIGATNSTIRSQIASGNGNGNGNNLAAILGNSSKAALAQAVAQAIGNCSGMRPAMSMPPCNGAGCSQGPSLVCIYGTGQPATAATCNVTLPAGQSTLSCLANPLNRRCMSPGNMTCADGSSPTCPPDGVLSNGTRALLNQSFRVSASRGGPGGSGRVNATQISQMIDRIQSQMASAFGNSASLSVALTDLVIGSNMSFPSAFASNFSGKWGGSVPGFIRNLTVAVASDLGLPPSQVGLVAVTAAAGSGRRSLMDTAPTTVSIRVSGFGRNPGAADAACQNLSSLSSLTTSATSATLGGVPALTVPDVQAALNLSADVVADSSSGLWDFQMAAAAALDPAVRTAGSVSTAAADPLAASGAVLVVAASSSQPPPASLPPLYSSPPGSSAMALRAGGCGGCAALRSGIIAGVVLLAAQSVAGAQA